MSFEAAKSVYTMVLGRLFWWSESPQGDEYWRTLYNFLKYGNSCELLPSEAPSSVDTPENFRLLKKRCITVPYLRSELGRSGLDFLLGNAEELGLIYTHDVVGEPVIDIIALTNYIVDEGNRRGTPIPDNALKAMRLFNEVKRNIQDDESVWREQAFTKETEVKSLSPRKITYIKK